MPELTPDALAKFEKAVTDEVFMERLWLGKGRPLQTPKTPGVPEFHERRH
jgi:hypothetical protein